MAAADIRRFSSMVGTAMLLAGFAYTGVSSVRLYAQIFEEGARVSGGDSVDDLLAPANLSSGMQLKRAVSEANWLSGVDVVLIPSAQMPRHDVYQVYYSVSYLMYPTRVWLATTTCEEISDAAARFKSRHLILLGCGHAQTNASQVAVSDRMRLVELP
jgi:hypothetical protein